MTNPILAEYQALQAELAQAERDLTTLNNQRTAAGMQFQTDHPAIQAIDRAVQDQVAKVNRLRELVAAKAAAVAALDNATAQAVAEGLTPEAAFQKALADTQRAEGTKRILTYVGLGLLVVLVVVAIVWYRRKGKK